MEDGICIGVSFERGLSKKVHLGVTAGSVPLNDSAKCLVLRGSSCDKGNERKLNGLLDDARSVFFIHAHYRFAFEEKPRAERSLLESSEPNESKESKRGRREVA